MSDHIKSVWEWGLNKFLFIYLILSMLKVITLLLLNILALPFYLFILYAFFLHKENTKKFWKF